MKQNFYVVLIVIVLLAVAGCAKKQDKPVPQESAAASEVPEEFIVTEGEPQQSEAAADISGRELLDVGAGVTLAFEEPEHEWEIINVTQNTEKTEYAAVVRVADKENEEGIQSNWLEVQFFKADGSLLRKVTTSLGDYQLLSNSQTGEMTVISGRVICTDGSYEMIGDVSGYEINTFALVKDLKIIATVDIAFSDFNFVCQADEREEHRYQLNAQELKATLETDHIRYTIDFAEKRYQTERFYKDEDLEELIAVSDDGTVEVYTARSNGAGDSFWTQVVTKDKKSGKITFLTYLHDWAFGVLGADDVLVCNHLRSLELFNVKTAEKVDNFLDFSFGDKGELEYLLVGLYYDKEKERYVLAYRNLKEDHEAIVKKQAEIDVKAKPRKSSEIAAFSYKAPVYVTILNKEGNEIKKMNTDFRMYQFVDGCGEATVRITKNSDGSYTLDAGYEDKTTIKP